MTKMMGPVKMVLTSSTQMLDALCGLIPEIGASICAPVLTATQLGMTMNLEKMRSAALAKFKQDALKLFEWIAKSMKDKLSKALAQMKGKLEDAKVHLIQAVQAKSSELQQTAETALQTADDAVRAQLQPISADAIQLLTQASEGITGFSEDGSHKLEQVLQRLDTLPGVSTEYKQELREQIQKAQKAVEDELTWHSDSAVAEPRDKYCKGAECGQRLIKEGWQALAEFGTVRRFGSDDPPIDDKDGLFDSFGKQQISHVGDRNFPIRPDLMSWYNEGDARGTVSIPLPLGCNEVQAAWVKFSSMPIKKDPEELALLEAQRGQVSKLQNGGTVESTSKAASREEDAPIDDVPGGSIDVASRRKREMGEQLARAQDGDTRGQYWQCETSIEGAGKLEPLSTPANCPRFPNGLGCEQLQRWRYCAADGESPALQFREDTGMCWMGYVLTRASNDETVQHSKAESVLEQGLVPLMEPLLQDLLKKLMPKVGVTGRTLPRDFHLHFLFSTLLCSPAQVTEAMNDCKMSIGKLRSVLKATCGTADLEKDAAYEAWQNRRAALWERQEHEQARMNDAIASVIEPAW